MFATSSIWLVLPIGRKPIASPDANRLTSRTFVIAAFIAGCMLALSGCSSFGLRHASVVATPFKTCDDPKPDTPPQAEAKANESDVTQLDRAFVWARTRQVFVADPADLFFNTSDVEQALQLLKRATELTAAQKADANVAAPADPEIRLIGEIPWLDDPIAADSVQILESQDTMNAANLGLSVIHTLALKHADLRSALMPKQTRSTSADAAATPAAAESSASEARVLEPKKITSVGDEERQSMAMDFQEIAAFRAFHVMTLLTAGRLMQDVSNAQSGTIDEHALRTHVQLFNIARFLSTYFDAYFRGGQFIAYTFDQNGEAAAASEVISRRIGAKLGGVLPLAQVKKIVASEIGALCGKNDGRLCATLTLGKTGFVKRAGLSVQFAGVSVSVGSGQSLAPQATYPKASDFGPQMIRVLIEAIFDANGPHPKSVHQSTACVSGLFEGEECLDANAQPDALMMRIDMFASGAEALSSAGVGAIIRGGSVSALNNEAVANMLETFVGVSSRKVIERVLQAQALSCPRLSPVALQVKEGDDGS